MNRDVSWLNAFLFCVLLFGIGAIWSPLIVDHVETVGNVFEMISSMATVFAAMIALRALSSWREQSNSDREYQSIMAYRESLFSYRFTAEFFSLYVDYYIALREQDGEGKDIDTSIKVSYEELSSKWRQASDLYFRRWHSCRRFIPTNTVFFYDVSPRKIESFFENFKSDIDSSYQLGLINDLEVLNKKIKEFDDLLSSANKGIDKLLEEI